jgi:RNA recognition motif-containing protein
MSKSDAIERLRAAAARARSRSRERPAAAKKSVIGYAPEVDEHIEAERARQRTQISKMKNDKTTAATKERDDPRKDDCTIIVQGLKPETDERTIYQFFAKCGKVRDVQLLRDNNSFQDRKGKGVAYVEFYDTVSVLQAQQLNGQLLEGRAAKVSPVAQPEVVEFLRQYGIPLDEQVGIALRNAVPEVQQAAMSRSMADTSNPQAVLMKRIRQLSVEMSGTTRNVNNAEKPAALRRDTCVVLKNLFRPADVDLAAEPEFYSEIRDDVQGGCEQHGQVLEVFVDRESTLGRVVVKFASSEAASACQKAMNGRLFGGQTVVSHTMPEGEFEQFCRPRGK